MKIEWKSCKDRTVTKPVKEHFEGFVDGDLRFRVVPLSEKTEVSYCEHSEGDVERQVPGSEPWWLQKAVYSVPDPDRPGSGIDERTGELAYWWESCPEPTEEKFDTREAAMEAAQKWLNKFDLS